MPEGIEIIDVIDKARQGSDAELERRKERTRPRDNEYVYCATCSSVLALRRDRIEMNGAHEHTCTNPHGFTFHLGCYAQALGCTIAGQPMAADTWFPGFQWRLAACSECNVHLGWYFDRGEAFFYGLILNRIQTE